MFVYIGYFYTLNEFIMIMHFRRRGRLMTSVVVPQAVLWICRGHLKNIHNYCKPGRKHPEYSSFIMSFYVFLIQMNFHTLQMFIIFIYYWAGLKEDLDIYRTWCVFFTPNSFGYWGAGMYAYTLVGLCFDSETGEVWIIQIWSRMAENKEGNP